MEDETMQTPPTGNLPAKKEAVPAKGNEATASLVLGIISAAGLLFCHLSALSVITGIIGLVMASKAKARGCDANMRTAGFILSLIGMIGGVVATISAIALLSYAKQLVRTAYYHWFWL